MCDRNNFAIKYELGTSSNDLVLTDTEVNAILPGGHVGLFKVVVYKEGFGFSVEATPNVANFEYIIRVDSVNFLEGSLNGGTELEITGINFAVSKTDN